MWGACCPGRGTNLVLLAGPPKMALLSDMIASEVLLGLAVGDGRGTDRHWRWGDSGGLPLLQDHLCSPRMGLQMVHEWVNSGNDGKLSVRLPSTQSLRLGMK